MCQSTKPRCVSSVALRSQTCRCDRTSLSSGSVALMRLDSFPVNDDLQDLVLDDLVASGLSKIEAKRLLRYARENAPENHP